MISNACIHRPVLASVISLVILIIGMISMTLLPIEQYPDIAPPMVSVSASYTGADAMVVTESIAAPIEQEINGAPNMLYMSSESTSSGNYTLNITFEPGTDIDIAAIEIQNRVKDAESRLPAEVVSDGISVSKKANALIKIIGIRADNEDFDETYIYNYSDIHVREALRRIPGVGTVSMYGTRPYSMRIWLDPLKLAALSMTPSEVRDAVKEQNSAASAGTIGEEPATKGVEMVFPITAKGRLTEVEEFENIIVRVSDSGAIVRLRDVARVELASYSYSVRSRLDGADASVIAVYLLPGANMLKVADEIDATLAELEKAFPEGMEYVEVQDCSQFVRESIKEVRTTLFQATLLVIAVVFLFLKSVRSTLIPALTIPISLVGTFAIMLALGFSINTFTLLALVLAIGIVVDDAIVVVENVERLIGEKGLSPMQATIEAMRELANPLIATSLVLVAVFLPVSFLGGITGQLFRQFGITISAAVVLSTVVALTLSPALCALILKPSTSAGYKWLGFMDTSLNYLECKLVSILKPVLKMKVLTMLIFSILVGVAAWLFKIVPGGFLPTEDQAYFNVEISLPEGSSNERTNKVVKKLENAVLNHPAVDHVFSRSGSSSRYGTAESKGNLFVALKPWDERTEEEFSVESLVALATERMRLVPEAKIAVLQPVEIPGFGENSGFEMQVIDGTGTNPVGLMDASDDLVEVAEDHPHIADVGAVIRPEIPQFYFNLDRERAKAMGITVTSVFSTIKSFFSRGYVSDFNKFGRVYRVSMQAESEFRGHLENAALIHIKSSSGQMLPITSLGTFQSSTSPGSLKRFNMNSSVTVSGSPARGKSSGQAMSAMVETAEKVLPPGIRYEWSGLSFQEARASGQTIIALSLALIFMFLFLAALYESWALPVSIVLIVPIAVLGAILSIFLRGSANDIYFQIGVVALVGLSAKNAILIVEFAKVLYDKGMTPVEAAIEAARQRFRPILMTSLSFIFGLLPLVIASGAGAKGRQSIGTGVFGGMMISTLLGLVLVPLFFVVLMKFAKQSKESEAEMEGSVQP